MTLTTLPEALATANQLYESAAVDVPATAVGVSVQLTSSQWTGTGRVLWGLQLSYDGGMTWGPGFADNASSNPIGGNSRLSPAWIYSTNTIGDLSRQGNMPHVELSGDTVVDGPAIVRLFAWPESDVPLGAVIETT